MRTFVAVVLMVAAALLACCAVAGSSVNQLAHAAGPAREIAGSLPQDEAVRAALPPVVTKALADGIPAGLGIPDAVRGPLEQATSRAVAAALDHPGFDDAWLKGIDTSRREYVARLGQVHSGERDTAPAVLELGPLASLGVAGLKDAVSGMGLGFLVGMLPTEVSASVPLDVPGTDASGSARLATMVWLSAGWAWAAVGAAALAVVAVATARPRGRGPVVALGGLVVCLAASGLLAIAAGIVPDGAPSVADPDPDSALAAAVTAQVLQGLSDYIVRWAVPTLVGGAAAVALGGVMRLLVGRPRNR